MNNPRHRPGACVENPAVRVAIDSDGMECLPLMMADDRILNQSLAPLDVRDPVLKARKVQNSKYIAEVMKEYAKRAVLVPWRDDEKARDAAVAGRGSNAA